MSQDPMDFKIDEDGNFLMIDEETEEYVSCEEWSRRKLQRDLAKLFDEARQEKLLELIDELREEAKKEEPTYGSALWERCAKKVPEYVLADHFIKNSTELFETLGYPKPDPFDVVINDDRTVTVKMGLRIPAEKISFKVDPDFWNIDV